jgi:hypothetical protein
MLALTTLTALWGLGAWFACAGFSAYVASQKGRSAIAWCVLGFLFSIFALIAVAGLPVRERRI